MTNRFPGASGGVVSVPPSTFFNPKSSKIIVPPSLLPSPPPK